MERYIEDAIEYALFERDESANGNDMAGIFENIIDHIHEVIEREQIIEREVDRYIEATKE